MNNFEYLRAADISGAAQFVGGRDGAKFIAGGTNLVDLMKYSVVHPTALVDLNRLGLHDILIGQIRRRDLSVLPLSHQLLMGAKRCNASPHRRAHRRCDTYRRNASHADHLGTVVAVVRRPPRNRGGQKFLDLLLELCEVNPVKSFHIIEAIAERIGLRPVDMKKLDL